MGRSGSRGRRWGLIACAAVGCAIEANPAGRVGENSGDAAAVATTDDAGTSLTPSDATVRLASDAATPLPVVHNWCGGDVGLSNAPGDPCAPCGRWWCDGPNALMCVVEPEYCERDAGRDVARGDDAGRAARPGPPDAGGHALNACGGYSHLRATPGDPCGACSTWRCDGHGGLTCADVPANACGGCRPLDATISATCGECGRFECDGPDALRCAEPPFGCPSTSCGPGAVLHLGACWRAGEWGRRECSLVCSPFGARRGTVWRQDCGLASALSLDCGPCVDTAADDPPRLNSVPACWRGRRDLLPEAFYFRSDGRYGRDEDSEGQPTNTRRACACEY